jgi:hypothetical protein
MDLGIVLKDGTVQFRSMGDAMAAVDAGLDASKVKVQALDGSVRSLTDAIKQFDMGNSITYDLSTDKGIAAFESANPGATISWSNAQIEAFISKGGTVQQLEDMGVINVYGKLAADYGQMPGFANGVTNFAGGLALVGEHGPEMVNLPGGSDVYKNGVMPGGDTYNVYVTGIGTPAQLIASVSEGIFRATGRKVTKQ